MPRTPIIVHLADGKDHLIIDGEVTGCGQIVPHGLEWLASTTKRCTTCFPDGKVESVEEASEAELIAEQQEAAGKPAKATPSPAAATMTTNKATVTVTDKAKTKAT
jgi:hypothetical protein